jgi:hypothetical protein
MSTTASGLVRYVLGLSAVSFSAEQVVPECAAVRRITNCTIQVAGGCKREEGAALIGASTDCQGSRRTCAAVALCPCSTTCLWLRWRRRSHTEHCQHIAQCYTIIVWCLNHVLGN